MKRLYLLLLLPLLLVACAPAAAGSSARNPLRPNAGEPISTVRGTTVYVRLDYALDDFRLKADDFSSRLWIPAGANSESANVASDFALLAPQAPAGWSLELAEMRVLRSRTVSFGTTTGTDYSLRAVVAVRVPAAAALGTTTVSATLRGRGGSQSAVTLPLRVRDEVR